MNGTANAVVETDYNHAAKNMRSQLVLGCTVVMGGNAFSTLALAGAPMALTVQIS